MSIKSSEPMTRYNLRLPAAQVKKLESIREKDGVPVNEQIRRAIDFWLERGKK